MINRRGFLQSLAVGAAGLLLPQTTLVTDADEIAGAAEEARRYWALDQTHVHPYAGIPVEAADAMVSPWWRVAQVIGENRYMTMITLGHDVVLTSLRVGDTLQIGDLPDERFYSLELPRQEYQVRHIDREKGVVTVTNPIPYPTRVNASMSGPPRHQLTDRPSRLWKD